MVLATSMLQVGVDVERLGLMLVVGQPKNTAEYIQASSRVGRQASRPGLVVNLGNWARPRDLAHFEQFRHYHETFYAQVEALSVTPFSATSLDRGLDGVLVSAARVLTSVVPDGLSPEQNAGRIDSPAGLRPRMSSMGWSGGRGARRMRTPPSGRGSGCSTGSTSGPPGASTSRTCTRPLYTSGSSDEAKYDALMMSAENARARQRQRRAPPSWSRTPCARYSRRSTSWSARSKTTWSTSSHPARCGGSFLRLRRPSS